MTVTIDVFLIKELKENPRLIHGFSPRQYKNPEQGNREYPLGMQEGEADYKKHRQWFLRSMRIECEDIFLVRQVHGNKVFLLSDPSMTTRKVRTVEADAIVTHLTGKPLGILTADCLPIIVYDPQLHIVGVAHAGRLGTAQRVLSKTISRMREEYASRPEHILIGMGPGIGGCCYEVDEACLDQFMKGYREWETFAQKKPGNKFHLDLFKANEEDARSVGILPEHIFRSGQCTSCNNDRWFSFRREGNRDRILSLAMLR